MVEINLSVGGTVLKGLSHIPPLPYSGVTEHNTHTHIHAHIHRKPVSDSAKTLGEHLVSPCAIDDEIVSIYCIKKWA